MENKHTGIAYIMILQTPRVCRAKQGKIQLQVICRFEGKHSADGVNMDVIGTKSAPRSPTPVLRPPLEVVPRAASRDRGVRRAAPC